MSWSDPDPTTPPQVIPRPAAAVEGGPAPWEVLAPRQRVGLSLTWVLEALERSGQTGAPPQGAVDGAEAWVTVFDTPPPGPAAPSAVLVALFEEDGETRVILTRRSSQLRSHQGEVSFPGGRIDPGEDAEGAALREASEEVGLNPSEVRVSGWLHPVLTFLSGSLITPVLGLLDARPALEPNPAEVERVFDVSLAALAADGAFHEERWRLPGRSVRDSPDGSYPVWFFDVAGEIVWGATARMLYELMTVVLGVPGGP